MNQLLKELYRSCRSKEALASQDSYNSADVLIGSEVQKFAELIVRECAEVARLNTRVDSKVYLMIKEHFGVEE